MPDFGEDLAGIEDIDAELSTVSGKVGLAHAIARRFITNPGSLWYSPRYGYNVRQHLNAPVFTPGLIAHNCEAQALLDERVSNAQALVSLVGTALRIQVRLESAFGTFTMVATVDALTIQVLVS